ncbi:MAG: phosphoribosyltransferase family protein [Alphaproteobacteria bacterium]|nr:phosphoribosyltransferase family protein [Alphaproteobacteria bacterium]
MRSIKEMLASEGAVLNGHFKLASGLHGAKFLSCAKVVSEPSHAEKIIKELAKQFHSERIDFVLGVNEAGAILAHGVARELDTRFVLARASESGFSFARGFSVTSGSNVLIIDDVTTTGGTVLKLVDLCRKVDANVIGVGLVATKGLRELNVGCRVAILAKLDDFDAWPPESCPLCKKGIPLNG